MSCLIRQRYLAIWWRWCALHQLWIYLPKDKRRKTNYGGSVVRFLLCFDKPWLYISTSPYIIQEQVVKTVCMYVSRVSLGFKAEPKTQTNPPPEKRHKKRETYPSVPTWVPTCVRVEQDAPWRNSRRFQGKQIVVSVSCGCWRPAPATLTGHTATSADGRIGQGHSVARLD